jgi:predicted transcriptional regulator
MVADQGAGRLGPLEAEVMAVLWASDRPMPVRDVVRAVNAGRGSPLAYTTVLTVMTRLAGKKVLARSRTGREYRYTPVAADIADVAVRGVLDEFGDSALARFVDRVELDPELRDRLRGLIGDIGDKGERR